MLNNRV